MENQVKIRDVIVVQLVNDVIDTKGDIYRIPHSNIHANREQGP